MKRRAPRRGRFIVGGGVIIALLGLILPWWTIVRTGAPTLTGSGFEDVGIFVFLAGLAMLALIVLPFASADGDSALDRPSAYVVLAGIAIAAFVFRVFQIAQFGGLGLPTSSPGLWLTGGGLLIVAFGVGDILTTQPTE